MRFNFTKAEVWQETLYLVQPGGAGQHAQSKILFWSLLDQVQDTEICVVVFSVVLWIRQMVVGGLGLNGLTFLGTFCSLYNNHFLIGDIRGLQNHQYADYISN